MDVALTPGQFTLGMYIVVLVPLMLLGYFFASRKQFNAHKLIMTSVVVLNWALIIGVMLNSYRLAVVPDLPDNLSGSFALVPTIHGIVGLVAQLMATYLVLLMWTENTPLENIVIYRIKSIKTPMRVTLSLWLITVVLGFGVYGVWYGGSTEASDEAVIESTEEAAVDSTEEASKEGTDEADIDATEEATAEEPAVDATEAAAEDAQDTDEAEVDATEEAEPEVDTTEEAGE